MFNLTCSNCNATYSFLQHSKCPNCATPNNYGYAITCGTCGQGYYSNMAPACPACFPNFPSSAPTSTPTAPTSTSGQPRSYVCPICSGTRLSGQPCPTCAANTPVPSQVCSNCGSSYPFGGLCAVCYPTLSQLSETSFEGLLDDLPGELEPAKCTRCGRELSSTMDAFWGKDEYDAKLCQPCRFNRPF